MLNSKKKNEVKTSNQNHNRKNKRRANFKRIKVLNLKDFFLYLNGINFINKRKNNMIKAVGLSFLTVKDVEHKTILLIRFGF